jgi:hypothetical protein
LTPSRSIHLLLRSAAAAAAHRNSPLDARRSHWTGRVSDVINNESSHLPCDPDLHTSYLSHHAMTRRHILSHSHVSSSANLLATVSRFDLFRWFRSQARDGYTFALHVKALDLMAHGIELADRVANIAPTPPLQAAVAEALAQAEDLRALLRSPLRLGQSRRAFFWGGCRAARWAHL